MGNIKRLEDIERQNEILERAKRHRDMIDTANTIKKEIFKPAKKKEPPKPKSKWYKFIVFLGKFILLLFVLGVILGFIALIKFCVKYIFGL